MRNLKLALAPILALMLICGLGGIAQADSVYLIVAADDSGVFADTPSFDEDYTIINYASIIGGHYPWPLDMAVAADGDRFTLTRGEESVTFGRNTLTKLFFGPERVSPFAADAFPLPFWQWPLEHV